MTQRGRRLRTPIRRLRRRRPSPGRIDLLQAVTARGQEIQQNAAINAHGRPGRRDLSTRSGYGTMITLTADQLRAERISSTVRHHSRAEHAPARPAERPLQAVNRASHRPRRRSPAGRVRNRRSTRSATRPDASRTCTDDRSNAVPRRYFSGFFQRSPRSNFTGTRRSKLAASARRCGQASAAAGSAAFAPRGARRGTQHQPAQLVAARPIGKRDEEAPHRRRSRASRSTWYFSCPSRCPRPRPPSPRFLAPA